MSSVENADSREEVWTKEMIDWLFAWVDVITNDKPTENDDLRQDNDSQVGESV